MSIHNPEYHGSGHEQEAILKEFRESKTGHVINFFNNRIVKGHLATNEQIYREYDGSRMVSERKFTNKSYIFYEGEFEDLLNEAGFRADQVWGGHKYEPRTDGSRFLVYQLARK